MIERVGPDDWRLWRGVRLEALAEAPEAFGSRLADWVDAGEARWRERLANVPCNVVARRDVVAIGQASGSPSGDDVELISMWVAPPARRTGVADALVDAIARWARTIDARRLVLDVKRDNLRARRFYARCGFRACGTADDPDELRLARSL